LQPIPITREEVFLPEFGEGVSVWVHGMTAKEKGEHDAAMIKADFSGVSRNKAKQQKQRMVIACSRDEVGGKLFNDADLEMISGWPASIVERITKAADRMNGDSNTDELAKNSDATDAD